MCVFNNIAPDLTIRATSVKIAISIINNENYSGPNEPIGQWPVMDSILLLIDENLLKCHIVLRIVLTLSLLKVSLSSAMVLYVASVYYAYFSHTTFHCLRACIFTPLRSMYHRSMYHEPVILVIFTITFTTITNIITIYPHSILPSCRPIVLWTNVACCFNPTLNKSYHILLFILNSTQNDQQFADGFLKCMSVNKNHRILK